MNCPNVYFKPSRKLISQFLFLGVEDILVLYPPYKTRNLFLVQTLFSSRKPRFYYTSIVKLIYVYYSANQVKTDLKILHLLLCLTLFLTSFYCVNVCLLWVKQIECSPLLVTNVNKKSQIFFIGIYRCSI
jgi:hypothetical protein